MIMTLFCYVTQVDWLGADSMKKVHRCEGMKTQQGG